MQIEYSYYDVAANETEIKENLKIAITYPIYSISVLPYYVKLAKTIIGSHPIKVSTVIDYPLGLSDTSTRISATNQAIKNGASSIEIVAPTQILSNRKYDKFREDITNQINICKDKKIELKYILEYRIFHYELLYKISQILKTQGISDIYPSTGYLLDDIYDNLLASALINKKNPEINVISTGNIWNNDQITKILKMNLYGFKINSINALDLLFQNKKKTQKNCVI